MRDFAGTGAFSSEYIVATKSVGNFDITTGLGWGILGLENSIRNPFNSLDSSFQTRGTSGGNEGGEFNYSVCFPGQQLCLEELNIA